ncbi:hypothetical protein FI667_g15300, partial [Globisporangium splendens]
MVDLAISESEIKCWALSIRAGMLPHVPVPESASSADPDNPCNNELVHQNQQRPRTVASIDNKLTSTDLSFPAAVGASADTDTMLEPTSLATAEQERESQVKRAFVQFGTSGMQENSGRITQVASVFTTQKLLWHSRRFSCLLALTSSMSTSSKSERLWNRTYSLKSIGSSARSLGAIVVALKQQHRKGNLNAYIERFNALESNRSIVDATPDSARCPLYSS